MVGRTVVALIAALALLYVGDWAVWRARVAAGGGMGTVTVSTIVVTPLKNNKEEYDWGGTGSADCSKSIFTHAGSGTCWWLRRHNVVYDR